METIERRAVSSRLHRKNVRTPGRAIRNGRAWRAKLGQNGELYLMLIPPLVYYLLFHYGPMYGLQIAFKNFLASRGIWDSPWVGLKHFERFFSYYNFGALLRNTLSISIYSIIAGFFLPILLALLLHEVKNGPFRRFVQNAVYIPHFLSVVVVVGLIQAFTSLRGGVINTFIGWLGMEPVAFMIEKSWFRTLLIGSDLWQHGGWSAIIYLAALAGINPELNEAAIVDGAGKLGRMIHVSLPGILPTIIIMLILRMGHILDVGFEKIFLMQNDPNLPVSDVIATYVYRTGILEGQYSFSSAVGLFNSAANFAVLLTANFLARKFSDSSLW